MSRPRNAPRNDLAPAPVTIADIVNQVVASKLDASTAINMIEEIVDQRVADLFSPPDKPIGPQSWPAWFFSTETPGGVLVETEESLAKLPPGRWFASPAHVTEPALHSHFEIS